MSKVANIKFNGGIIHTPSDMSPMDGDLNECINLVPSDGELKPIEMPVKEKITPVYTNQTLSAVHSTNNGKHFIFVVYNDKASHIHIKDAENAIVFTWLITNEEVKWVETVGNTVVFGTDKNIHYALYKNGAYNWLGNSMPRPVIDFHLEYGNLITSKDPTPSTLYQNTGEVGSALYLTVPRSTVNAAIGLCSPQNLLNYYLDRFNYSYHSDTNQISSSGVRDNILSKLAKITNEAKEKNQFIFPFIVRYALRLYDNTHVCLSQPILMMPSSTVSPIFTTVNCYHIERNISSDQFTYYDLFCNIYMYGLPSRLKYNVKGFCDANNAAISNIDDWSDIIKGVDIFISSPISPIDMDYISIAKNWQITYNGYGHDGYDSYSYGRSYVLDASKLIADEIENRIGGGPGGLVTHLNLRSKDLDLLYEDIKNTNIFYLAKRFDADTYNSSINQDVFFDEHVGTGTLANLETSTVLKDEYLSRSKISAMVSHVYNQRLILGNLKVQAPLWYPITELAGSGNSVEFYEYELCFKLEKQDKTIYIRAATNGFAGHRFGHLIFYPDTDCKEVVVKRRFVYNGTEYNRYVTLKMHEHPGLNGSIAILPYLLSLNEYFSEYNQGSAAGDLPQGSTDRYYLLSNNLFISIVGNPFNYLAENMLEVGRLQIMGINSTPIPMSTGQFGQHPLIVFANDGVFAIGVNAEGELGGISLVSSADTISTIAELGRPNIISDGQSLYFITKRGLMELRGLQVRCVSEILNGRKWKYSDYRNSDVPVGGSNTQNIVALLKDGITDGETFNQMIMDGDAFLAFDYKHNRILVTDPKRKSHYLYSISSDKWCKLVFGGDLENYQLTNINFINIAEYENAVNGRGNTLTGDGIISAVFDYEKSYIQTINGKIYDLMGALDENVDDKYKFGFIASRPMRLGSDDHKSITRILHRKRIDKVENPQSVAAMRLYGSVDGIRFYEITSLRGASYKYFVVLLYTCMKANERYSYMSVEFEERFQNKLR